MTVHYAYCERSADSAHGEQNTGGPEKLQERGQRFATLRELVLTVDTRGVSVALQLGGGVQRCSAVTSTTA